MGLIGSWEGYISTPLYLYNNGTWSNLQTTGTTSTASGTIGGTEYGVYDRINYLAMRGDPSYRPVFLAIRLNQTINISGYNYIKAVTRALYDIESEYTGIGVSQNSQVQSIGDFASYAERITSSVAGTQILNVASLTGNYYIYFFARRRIQASLGSNNMDYGLSSLYLSNN